MLIYRQELDLSVMAGGGRWAESFTGMAHTIPPSERYEIQSTLLYHRLYQYCTIEYNTENTRDDTQD